MTWIPVKERIPERIGGAPLWVLVTDGKEYDVALVLKGALIGHRELTATHWMDLPEIPQ